MVGGARRRCLLFGTLESSDLDEASVTEHTDVAWAGHEGFGVIAVAGLVAQTRMTARLRASAREQLASSGGSQLSAG